MKETPYTAALLATDPNGDRHRKLIAEGDSLLGGVGFYIWLASKALTIRKVAGDLRNAGFSDVTLFIEKN